jgi:hypothetical protein
MEGFIGNATTQRRKYNENESNVLCSFDGGGGRSVGYKYACVRVQDG